MIGETCTIEGCDRPLKCRGWCSGHYQRWRIKGDPGGAIKPQKKPASVCEVEDCSEPHYGKGWCRMHYRSWSRHGDPLAAPRLYHGTASERFWKRVDKTGDCWLWTGGVDWDGYGLFRGDNCTIGAHRFAYQDLRGAIPDGYVTDHLCRVRRCVNPDHMEIVTPAENTRRANKVRWG